MRKILCGRQGTDGHVNLSVPVARNAESHDDMGRGRLGNANRTNRPCSLSRRISANYCRPTGDVRGHGACIGGFGRCNCALDCSRYIQASHNEMFARLYIPTMLHKNLLEKFNASRS